MVKQKSKSNSKSISILQIVLFAIICILLLWNAILMRTVNIYKDEAINQKNIIINQQFYIDQQSSYIDYLELIADKANLFGYND